MNNLEKHLSSLLDELSRCGKYIYWSGNKRETRQFKIYPPNWERVDGNNGLLKQIIQTQEQIGKQEQANAL